MRPRLILDPSGRVLHLDPYGRAVEVDGPVEDMVVPVRCRPCGQVYDLCAGEPVARYADCTVYVTPCCGRTVDDREWVANAAFDRITVPGRPTDG